MCNDLKPTTHFVVLNNTAKASDNMRIILSNKFQHSVWNNIRLLATGVK